MFSRSMQIALLMSALALMPLALQAQPARDVAAPKQVAVLQQSAFVLDVPIEEIAATLGGCAILDKDFPGLRTHTMYEVIKAMTLHQIAAMSHGRITAVMLAQAQIDLSALPIKRAARGVHQTDVKDLDFASPGGQGVLSDNYPK